MKLAEMSEIDFDDKQYSPGIFSFTKLHGNGNDFILVDEVGQEMVPEAAKASFAVRCCHRNFGIGGDGILFLTPSSRADLGMRLFQPDGSEAEMCGNGIRCLAKHAWEAGYVETLFDVETLAGIISIQIREMDNRFWAKVDMGVPLYERSRIPAAGSGEFIKEKLEGFEVSAINTGVPHTVIFVESLDIAVEELAPAIRYNPAFPEGANVNFVNAAHSFRIRTYERGLEAESFSCGTGAVACAAVARKLGEAGDEVLVQTKGGPLIVSFDGDRAYLEGPAVTVYQGELSEEFRWKFSQEI